MCLEFKEIRKEWKQRKKEEEAQRKAEEERRQQQQVAAAAAAAQNGGAEQHGTETAPTSSYASSRAVHLPPPIGYQQPQYPAPPGGSVPQQPLSDYNASHMYPPSYQHPPPSPYGQPNQSNMPSQAMYSQGVCLGYLCHGGK
ncbi:hypothetical protein CDD82_6346 [Ophiocordyceps australis]|uniref:Uncharacterized protein n=1 Tax=Ophiocordyceps australis TaxID=1399860 RepID=A0A2C5YWL9_9HYPO|nr:hypothetical protein CDD82_6346 [Ophiocordyceps australis]